MRFRLGTTGNEVGGYGGVGGGGGLYDSFAKGFQTMGMLPLYQAQAADEAQTADMKRGLMSSEIAAHVADAALKNTKQQTLAGAPDVLDTVIAGRVGTDVPTLQAWRNQVRTGQVPSVTVPGDPTADAPVMAGQVATPIDARLGGRLATEYGRYSPAYVNPEDFKVQDLAAASGAYQKQDAVDAIARDPRQAANYGQAYAAIDGKPLVQNIGNTGRGFNQFSGAGGTLDAGLSALYDQDEQAQIGQRNAAAGASRASAASSYASADHSRALTAKTRQEIEQGVRTGSLQVVTGPNGEVTVVDKVNMTAQPVIGADGKPVIKGAAGGGGKPLTDTQAKANLFGGRMLESDKILGDLEAQGVTRPGGIKSVTTGVLGALPIIGPGAAEGGAALTNWTQSPMQQQVEQARRDFVNAVLRRESGAAISQSEFDNANKQYFPQPGDSPQVLVQKARNRKIATTLMLQEVPEAQRYRVGQVPAGAPPLPVGPQAGGATGRWGPPTAAAGWSIERVN